MKCVLSRLTALEHSYLQDPLVLLCVDGDGNQKEMTVSEALQSDSFGFSRVVRGSSLKDLDKLLFAFRERVLQDTERGGAE